MRFSQPTRLHFAAVFAAALLSAFPVFASAQTEQVLYSFYPNIGAAPIGQLIVNSQGNLFGLTSDGGNFGAHGAFFELSNSSGVWTENILTTFDHLQNGWNPAAGLVADTSGNYYGVTLAGGTSTTTCVEGCGVVFELSPTSGGGWQQTVLHDFGALGDGEYPEGGLAIDAAGNLYGTTAYGGANNFGTVFKLKPTSSGWKETVLHSFTGGVDGATPQASIILDPSRNIFGTTYAGGNLGACPKTSGCGVAFELSAGASGWKESVLHTFTGGVDGANPLAGLVFDAYGNLFGTTYVGGDLNACSTRGCGTVFELSHTSKGWKITVRRTFGGGSNGSNPAAGLTFDPAGNLYGTTQTGGQIPCAFEQGNPGCGVVFKLAPATGLWNFTVLHAFTAHPDGAYPNDTLVFDQSGNLYGTTTFGGVDGDGIVFEVTP